jgi:putative transposase
MLINKALKIRLYPNKKQIDFFEFTFNGCRFLYNYLLSHKTDYYFKYKDDKEQLKKYKSPTEKELKKEFEFLLLADAIALQQTNRDLYDAFKNYFRNFKNNTLLKLTEEKLKKLSRKKFKTEISKFIAYHPGYPQFKSKKDNHRSYRTFDSNKDFLPIDNENSKIKLPKIGWIKFRHSHTIPENIKSVTISKNSSNEYYASLLYEDEIDDKKYKEIDENECIAFDMSAKDFLIASNEEKFENNKFYRKNERRLKIRQRKLSKKENNSNNKKKQRLVVAKTFQKVKNQKNYWLHSITKYLINKYKAIFIEDLNIKGMQKFNSGLSKTITLDFSWYQFTEMLKYKLDWNKGHLIKIDRFFPSSKLCSECGQINNDLTLKDRVWTCDCGTIHDRDKNAAINIFREGINLLKNSTVVHTESHAYGDMILVTGSA